MSPEQFLIACPIKESDTDGFRLEANGPAYGLALDKQGRFEVKQPCVFLLHLGGNNDRCGVYEHRPLVCQTYPMSLWAKVVSMRTDALCPPKSWPSDAVGRPAWYTALQQLRMQYDLYAEVVARWNAWLISLGPGVRLTTADFLSYVINVYDRLALLSNELGADEMRRVEETWPNHPRDDSAPVDPHDPPAWLRYLMRATRALQEFFPEIEPQTIFGLATSMALPHLEAGVGTGGEQALH